LITDLPADERRCKRYRKPMRQQQSFRDEKSHGFGWNASRIRDPQHAERRLLVMALAMAMAWPVPVSLLVIRTGQRHRFDRRDRRIGGAERMFHPT